MQSVHYSALLLSEIYSIFNSSPEKLQKFLSLRFSAETSKWISGPRFVKINDGGNVAWKAPKGGMKIKDYQGSMSNAGFRTKFGFVLLKISKNSFPDFPIRNLILNSAIRNNMLLEYFNPTKLSEKRNVRRVLTVAEETLRWTTLLCVSNQFPNEDGSETPAKFRYGTSVRASKAVFSTINFGLWEISTLCRSLRSFSSNINTRHDSSAGQEVLGRRSTENSCLWSSYLVDFQKIFVRLHNNR